MVLRDRLMEALGTLGLYGMKATFDEILAQGIKSRATRNRQPQTILNVFRIYDCDEICLAASQLSGRS